MTARFFWISEIRAVIDRAYSQQAPRNDFMCKALAKAWNWLRSADRLDFKLTHHP